MTNLQTFLTIITIISVIVALLSGITFKGRSILGWQNPIKVMLVALLIGQTSLMLMAIPKYNWASFALILYTIIFFIILLNLPALKTPKTTTGDVNNDSEKLNKPR